MNLMEKTGTPIGSYAPDFELRGTDRNVHHLSRYLETWRAVAVVFLCNNCSYVFSYLDKLREIQAQFQDRGFTLVGINANDPNQSPEDSFDNMKKLALEQQLNFPYLWDSTQDVAHSFGVERTPEVFLIDKMGILRYRGRIDDSLQEAEAVQACYLRNAIAALLAGEDISPQVTEAIGGTLKWRN
jgi:peroxiredoxin